MLQLVKQVNNFLGSVYRKGGNDDFAVFLKAKVLYQRQQGLFGILAGQV